MTSAWSAGDIIEIDLPPCLDGRHLAGTHPFIVLGWNARTGEIFGLACTSRQKDGAYFLSKDVSGLRLDSYVICSVRSIGPEIVRRARYLGRLPANYESEVRIKARRALRRLGLDREDAA